MLSPFQVLFIGIISNSAKSSRCFRVSMPISQLSAAPCAAGRRRADSQRLRAKRCPKILRSNAFTSALGFAPHQAANTLRKCEDQKFASRACRNHRPRPHRDAGAEKHPLQRCLRRDDCSRICRSSSNRFWCNSALTSFVIFYLPKPPNCQRCHYFHKLLGVMIFCRRSPRCRPKI